MTKALYEALVKVHEAMGYSENWAITGICDQAMSILRYDLEELSQVDVEMTNLRNLMATWPKASGNQMYPIPSPQEGVGPGQVYHARCIGDYAEAAHMWNKETSPYAVLRWELLDFLIETTKPE